MKPALAMVLAGPTAGTEQRAQGQGLRADDRRQVDLRQLGGDGDADLGRGRMDVGLGGADVGPLLDQPCRQAERQVGRQLQVVELEVLGQRRAGQAAGQGGEQVALLGQRLLQGRQGRLGLRQRRLLGGDVGAGDGAEPGLALQDAERLALGGDDALGRLDLGAQRGLGDRRHDHVGGERQISGLEQEALRFGLRLGRFGRRAACRPRRRASR